MNLLAKLRIVHVVNKQDETTKDAWTFNHIRFLHCKKKKEKKKRSRENLIENKGIMMHVKFSQSQLLY